MTLGINFYTYQKKYQHYVTLILCYLFAILYGIWLQPNTVFLRNVCLVGGAILSLPIIYSNRKAFLSKAAIPIWLIVLLLAWVTFHLFYIGQEPSTQWMEYAKSWKKIAISFVFAIGLGVSIAKHFHDTNKLFIYWRIVYFGLMLPALIYFIKLAVTQWAPVLGISPSPHLLTSRAIFTDPFAVHRSGYVFFVLPALSIAIAKIALSIKEGHFSIKSNSIYILMLPITVTLFYIEDDRLGFLFTLFILAFAAIPIFKSLLQKSSAMKIIIALLLMGSIIAVGAIAYKKNEQWKTLLADAKVGLQVDRYDAWKYDRISHPNLPLNEYGKPASLSNYERTAWATVGSRLALQNPLGYGLMSQSFGRLCRINWPDSQTSWSHSAWLDFTLGYGFPGLFLLFVPALLAWKNSLELPNPWKFIGKSGLGVLILVFLVKEVSSEVYVNALIFLVILVSSMSVKMTFNCSLLPLKAKPKRVYRG